MDIILVDEIDNSVIESVADGPGVRIVIFLQGCNHKCKGCHNADTWNIEKGKAFSTDEVALNLVSKSSSKYVSGITISGGDPFFQEDVLFELVKKIKEENPTIHILVYTGYELEDIGLDNPILKYIDALMTGKFEKENQYPKKPFRGSRNQKLINLESDNLGNVFIKSVE